MSPPPHQPALQASPQGELAKTRAHQSVRRGFLPAEPSTRAPSNKHAGQGLECRGRSRPLSLPEPIWNRASPGRQHHRGSTGGSLGGGKHGGLRPRLEAGRMLGEAQGGQEGPRGGVSQDPESHRGRCPAVQERGSGATPRWGAEWYQRGHVGPPGATREGPGSTEGPAEDPTPWCPVTKRSGGRTCLRGYRGRPRGKPDGGGGDQVGELGSGPLHGLSGLLGSPRQT